MSNLPALRVPQEMILPDKGQYIHRFYIRSASSNALYTIAQHKTGKWWSCSCLGFLRHKHCKHLKSLGIPGSYTPYIPSITGG